MESLEGVGRGRKEKTINLLPYLDSLCRFQMCILQDDRTRMGRLLLDSVLAFCNHSECPFSTKPS